jgi:hypothetical protein
MMYNTISKGKKACTNLNSIDTLNCLNVHEIETYIQLRFTQPSPELYISLAVHVQMDQLVHVYSTCHFISPA